MYVPKVPSFLTQARIREALESAPSRTTAKQAAAENQDVADKQVAMEKQVAEKKHTAMELLKKVITSGLASYPPLGAESITTHTHSLRRDL